MTSVYFDIETGGLEFHHPNIQLAAIAVDDSTAKEIETFETKIAFEEWAATPEALKLNGYTPEAWAEAPSQSMVVGEFEAFLNRHRSLTLISKRTRRQYMVAKLVGYNAAMFDGPRLFSMFEKYSRFCPADRRVRCVFQRAMWWFDEQRVAPPNDFKLKTVCDYFGLKGEETDKFHDALTDVRYTIRLAQFLKGGAK